MNNSGKIEYSHAKEWSDTLRTPYTKINSRCIKDLNVRLKTESFWDKNVVENLHDISVGNNLILGYEAKAEIKQTKKYK